MKKERALEIIEENKRLEEIQNTTKYENQSFKDWKSEQDKWNNRRY